MIMQIMQELFYEEIKGTLIKYNWDKEKVVQDFRQKNMFKFAMTNCSNPSEQIHIEIKITLQTVGT
jgi:hypothetical protein